MTLAISMTATRDLSDPAMRSHCKNMTIEYRITHTKLMKLTKLKAIVLSRRKRGDSFAITPEVG